MNHHNADFYIQGSNICWLFSASSDHISNFDFRVLVDLNEEGKALSELSGSCLTLTKDGEYSRDVSDFIYEFQDSTSFALILAAEIHQTNRQYDRAADCYKKALAHNPFLFTPFQKLCQIGK